MHREELQNMCEREDIIKVIILLVIKFFYIIIKLFLFYIIFVITSLFEKKHANFFFVK